MGIEAAILGGVVAGGLFHSARESKKARRAGERVQNDQNLAVQKASQDASAERQRVQTYQNQYNASVANSQKRLAIGMQRNRRRVRGGGFGESKTMFSSADAQQPGLNPRLG